MSCALLSGLLVGLNQRDGKVGMMGAHVVGGGGGVLTETGGWIHRMKAFVQKQ
jgi:hypothetical protein